MCVVERVHIRFYCGFCFRFILYSSISLTTHLWRLWNVSMQPRHTGDQKDHWFSSENWILWDLQGDTQTCVSQKRLTPKGVCGDETASIHDAIWRLWYRMSNTSGRCVIYKLYFGLTFLHFTKSVATINYCIKNKEKFVRPSGHPGCASFVPPASGSFVLSVRLHFCAIMDVL